MRGWVYVFSNPGMPGLIKIGRTTDEPRTRAAQLHTTGVPTPFQVEYAVQVDDCDLLERRIHQHFRSHRMYRRREFFTVDLLAVVGAIESSVVNLNLCVLDVVDPRRERARVQERAEHERRERELAAREYERRRRIEDEAQMLIRKAREPVQAATAKTERVLHVAWAAIVSIFVVTFLAATGSVLPWVFVVAGVVYLVGRVIPITVASLVVPHVPWGRAAVEFERANLEAIAQRREQALRSPVVESIIAS